MPKAYEAMRNKFVAEGLGYDAAQAKAAAIYNSQHPSAPVGREDAKRKALVDALRKPSLDRIDAKPVNGTKSHRIPGNIIGTRG